MAVVAGVQVAIGASTAAYVNGLNQAQAATSKFVNTTTSQLNQVNTGFAKVSQTTRQMRGAFQNVGFQIQDIVVSLQMGMDPMRVFTQQAGQIAQIFGPMGAAIGVAATVVGALAGAWLNSASAAESLTDATKDLDGSLGDNIRTVDEAIEFYRTLTAEQRAFEAVALGKKLREETEGIAAQRQQLQELKNTFQGFTELGPVFGGLSDFDPEAFSVFTQLIGELERGEVQIGEFATHWNALINDMVRGGAEVPAQIKDTGDQLIVIVERMQKGEIAAAEFEKQLALLSGSMAENARTTKEAMKVVDDLIDSWDEAAKEAEQAAEASKREAEQAAKAQKSFDRSKIERQNRELADIAEQTVRRGNQAIAQQNKAREDLNTTLDETLKLQQLQLQGLDKESEAYRVQEALIKAKKAAGGELTAQQEEQIRLIEQQATAIDKQQEAAKESEKIFDNMVESMQSALADTFEDMFRDGVTSFQDLADSVTDIFVRMAAELAAKKIMEAVLDPQGFINSFRGATQAAAQQVTAIPAMASAPAPAGRSVGGPGQGVPAGMYGAGSGIPQTGGFYGPSGSGAAFTPYTSSGSAALGGGLAGAGMGFAIGQTQYKGHTGATVGGTIGGGIGGAVGSQFGPGGAVVGGFVGGQAGAFIGRQFGAGKGQDNKVFFQGQLGIGAGGTGAAAQLVIGIDKSIKSLLTATEEGVTNRLLEVAAGVRAQYDKEMSAADMANLAAGRIGPAAQAIGLQPDKIAVGTPEEQLANLEAAIGIMKQMEAIRLGPVQTQFRDLNKQFEMLREEADRLGVSTAGLTEEQARATQELHRQIKRQEIETYVAVGAMSDLDAQLQLLDLNMQEATAAAQALGVSTATLGVEHQRQAEIIWLQNHIQQLALMETVGAMDALSVALGTLDANMQIARINAERLGISTAGIGAAQATQAEAIVQQFRGGGGGGGGAAGPSREELERQRLQERLELHALMETVGVLNSFQHALYDLNAEMAQAAVEARRMGISTAQVARTHGLMITQLTQEDRLRRHASMEAVGILNSFQRAIYDLDAQMKLAVVEAQRLGYSTANVAKMHGLMTSQLTQEDRLRRHAAMEAVGILTPFQRAIYDLDAQMRLAVIEAQRLGISTANVAKIHGLMTTQLVQEDRLRRHAVMETVGVLTPFQRAIYDLDAQMKLAVVEAQRLGISTANVAREHGRLIDVLVREHTAAIDAQALSISAPFEQMLDPLKEFARSLSLGNLNPLGQMEAARDEFRRIAELARAGSTTAIQQLQGAGQAFVAEMERFGASPGGAAARIEVQSVIESVMADISQAQREASAGVEDAIAHASQRQVDTLRELIGETKIVAEEIKRLRR